MDIQVADPLIGSIVDGRYRVRGRIARGGMATVYTASDERLERTVALKIIHPAQAGDPQFIRRFTDEAKTIARLTHPNVVAVYDQGVHAGVPYLVMEYVRGRTLREVLAERGRLTPVEALAILEQVLAAVAAAHRAGLVHRDVKPENVLVAEAPSGGASSLVDGVVKVADFGLARAVEASADEAGQLMATVAYVAPELVTAGHADARTDVYSAGIVLFEMLTGRVPYDGEQPVEVAWQHVDRDVPPPSRFVPGLSPALDDLVTRATRRDPGARPTDAGALLADVQVVREDVGTASAMTTVMRPTSVPPATDATVTMRQIQPVQRPSWSRLPEQPQSNVYRTYPYEDGRPRIMPSPPAGGFGARAVALWERMVGTPRGRTVTAAAIVVVALLLAVGGYWFAIGRYTTAPQLTTMSRADAVAKAERAGLAVKFGDPRYDEQVPKDVVLTQEPGAGSRILKGATVTLILSLGPERFPTPDVVGKEWAVAQAELQDRKLVVKRGPDKYSDDIPAGYVLATDPKAGTETKPDAQIVVTVSKGKAPISVPNVIGKDVNEARAELQGLGLVVVEQQVDSDKPAGQVIAQSPTNGAGVEKGAEVRLQVSKGPPLTVVPQVTGQPCQQAKQTLEGMQLQVNVSGNPDGTVLFQDPGPDSQVPQGSQVTIGCL
ncbi:Stk1 family PASTA domain-containing Ser/Thr kinase [Rhizomonospora bruguierae]|uniref:Stk1 family PASTA domain-containing Ser/Thr kinase n=1 Tax=Rhizomonospora bruguierae TaxID=1581705 RepID=UPI001BCDC050|nr:Stk1 family PASTA domain-containing Ser/Thr kinase [Micromonospora sp. NBRC 107566]